MTSREMAITIISGLLINEVGEWCPWLARRLVRWSARRTYRDRPDRAEIRAEELVAVINDRPGKLFKLCTAAGFASSSLARQSRETTAGWLAGGRRLVRDALVGALRLVRDLLGAVAEGHLVELVVSAVVGLAMIAAGFGGVVRAFTGGPVILLPVGLVGILMGLICVVGGAVSRGTFVSAFTRRRRKRWSATHPDEQYGGRQPGLAAQLALVLVPWLTVAGAATWLAPREALGGVVGLFATVFLAAFAKRLLRDSVAGDVAAVPLLVLGVVCTAEFASSATLLQALLAAIIALIVFLPLLLTGQVILDMPYAVGIGVALGLPHGPVAAAVLGVGLPVVLMVVDGITQGVRAWAARQRQDADSTASYDRWV